MARHYSQQTLTSNTHTVQHDTQESAESASDDENIHN